MRIKLSGKEAHLWLVDTANIPAALDNELLARLTQPEQCRYNGFKIPAAKREYLITRALIRGALSCYADILPLEWRFVTNPYGRPQLASDFKLQLNFSISHSHGVVACLIAHHQVGLDIETQHRRTSFFDIANQVLSSREQAALVEKKADGIHFLHYWTMKEAYSKAIGLGLSMQFKDIVCTFNQNDDNEFSALDDFIALQKENWQFSHFSVLQHHLLAIAIGKKTPDDVAVRLMEYMPGVDDILSGRLLERTSADVVPHLYVKKARII